MGGVAHAWATQGSAVDDAATPFLSGSASPDTEGKTMPQGELQARCPHWTGLADPLGLVSLPQRRADRPFLAIEGLGTRQCDR